MRNIIFAIIFALPMIGTAQDLPEANKIVLEYAKSKIGQRVGKGICFNLVDSALCQVNMKWKNRKHKGDIHPYGKPIKREDVLPGDVMYIDGGVPQRSHVLIVVGVSPSLIKGIDQGVAPGENLKNSIVSISNFNGLVLSKRKLKYEFGYAKGQLKFYRPQS